MKISVVLAVLNGEESLEDSIKAILNQEYPASDFELVTVNDGSTDSTLEIMNSFKNKFKKKGIGYRVIDFEKNQGRIIARETGAREAEFDNLLFYDHRCIATKTLLKDIKEIGYEPLIGNLYQDPDRSLASRFFYILRRFIYKPYFGKDFEDVYIDKENFDDIAKGFCPFFCDKERLLRNLPNEKDVNVNDDTKIFSNIIQEKKILKTSKCHVHYLQRDNFKEMIWHIFHRGPRFVDFYLQPGTKYFWPIITAVVVPFLLIVLGVINFKLLLLALAFGLGLSAIAVVYLSKSLKDILSFIMIGPFIVTSFLLGVYKGIILKLTRK